MSIKKYDILEHYNQYIIIYIIINTFMQLKFTNISYYKLELLMQFLIS